MEGALDYRGEFRVSSNSFFQVNRLLIDRLVETAVDGAEGETALDLYAGVGLFSLALARRFREVTAVESGAGAVRDLQFNAERAGLENLRAEQRTAEEYLAQLEKRAGFRAAGSAARGAGQGGGARGWRSCGRGGSRSWRATRRRWRAIWRGWWRRAIAWSG